MNKKFLTFTALGAFVIGGCSPSAKNESEKTDVASMSVQVSDDHHLEVSHEDLSSQLTEHNNTPYIVDIEGLTLQNDNYRTSIWTGKYHQLTVMSIPVGGEIGLEIHPKVDQFIRLEQGRGLVEMGATRDSLTITSEVGSAFAVFVPAGTWHNVKNIGDEPLKLYTIYSPANHKAGTVHATYEMAWEEFYKEHPDLAPKK